MCFSIAHISPLFTKILAILGIAMLSMFAQPGDRILDTHLGSGSSRIAAYHLGFDFVGFESDKTYFDLQEQRFARHTAQMSLF